MSVRRIGAAGRPWIEVACGVMVRNDRILIACRPRGKVGAGKWEFPGGKLEAGETSRVALTRELDEELGVRVLDARPLARLCHSYTDRDVCLDTWRVDRFAGSPRAREGQKLEWVLPGELDRRELLASSWRVLSALRLPQLYGVLREAEDDNPCRIDAVPTGAWLLLARPQLDDRAYLELAQRVADGCRVHQLGVVVDRVSALHAGIGAVGLHLDQKCFASCNARPIGHDWCCMTEVRSRRELARAHALSLDAVVWRPPIGLGVRAPVPDGGPPTGTPGWLPEPGLPVYFSGQPGDLDEVFRRGGFGVACFPVYCPSSAGSSRKVAVDSGSPAMR